MKDIAATLVQAMPTDLTFNEANLIIKRKKELIQGVEEVFSKVINVSEILEAWVDFYGQEFGIELCLRDVRIPEHQKGFDWLLIMAQGLIIQQVYDKSSQHFDCYKYTGKNLDEVVAHNDRDPKNGPYAIWIRNREEADEELKNLSADDLKKKNIPGITLLERQLLELKYFKETGKHLDIQNWTLCSGSRYTNGNVPIVSWHSNNSKTYVCFYPPIPGRHFLRSRQVIAA